MFRQRRRTFRIAQLVDNHRSGIRLAEKVLRNFRMAIDAAGIDCADTAARDSRDREAPVFAARRKQLHGVAGGDAERFRQPRTDDDRVRIVAKILELPGDDLLANIGRLQVERGIDAEEIDGGVFKLGARAERPAQDRRAGRDIGKSPTDTHDLAGVRDALEIAAAGCFHAGVLWCDKQIAERG